MTSKRRSRATSYGDGENDMKGESAMLDDSFAKWRHIQSLTDAERDEIDFHVKLVVKQCLERVEELERGELRLASLNLLRGGAIARQRAQSDSIHAYHTAVTRYLSEQLARASTIQTTLQHRRIEAQQQRHRKLADGVQKNTSQLNELSLSGPVLRGTVGSLSQSGQEDIVNSMSKEQVQIYEEEASALMQSLQSELQAVHVAEQQLHDISELQTRIMQHLQQQNEQTSQLQTEAASHGEQVTSGNVQLRKAKERNRAANRYLSMFFIISGIG